MRGKIESFYATRMHFSATANHCPVTELFKAPGGRGCASKIRCSAPHLRRAGGRSYGNVAVRAAAEVWRWRGVDGVDGDGSPGDSLWIPFHQQCVQYSSFTRVRRTPACLSLCRSIDLSICLFVYLLTYLSGYLFICIHIIFAPQSAKGRVGISINCKGPKT